MRPLICCLLASLALTAGAGAGPLLSAKLEVEMLGIALTVDATSATGSLDGSHFTLDAGSAFAGAHCAGTSPACGGLTLPRPLTRMIFDAGPNGALSGDLSAASLSAQTGILGRLRLLAKVGKAPSFTLIAVAPYPTAAVPWVRFGEQTTCAFFTSFFSGCEAGVHGTYEIENDRWHLGPVTQTGLSFAGTASPDAMATGSVEQTPNGGTRVSLVSLSRVSQDLNFNTSFGYQLALFGRLTLLFAPEPSAPALFAGAGVVLALSRRARRGRRSEG